MEMTEQTKTQELRESLVNKDSAGYELTQVLYGKKEPREKYAKNKKVPVNLRLLRSDLELLDAISEQCGRSRAWILAYLLETDIERMFGVIARLDEGEVQQAQLALAVDDKMSKEGLEHDFKGKTWEWSASRITDDLYNPGVESIWDRQQRKKGE
jgi:hypothetical protein